MSLIDCGQFKSLSRSRRLQIAQLVLAVDKYQEAVPTGNTTLIDSAKIELANCARSFGIKCINGRESEDDLACAIALVLFSDTGITLPGGYSSNELDENSPIRLLTSFPQELILLGRATVLLKGIAKRLGVPLSLVDRWGEQCLATLETAAQPSLPLWGNRDMVVGNAFIVPPTSSTTTSSNGNDSSNKIRLRQVARLLQQWAQGKGQRFSQRLVKRLPPKLKTALLEYVLARQERLEAQRSNRKKE